MLLRVYTLSNTTKAIAVNDINMCIPIHKTKHTENNIFKRYVPVSGQGLPDTREEIPGTVHSHH